MTYQDLIEELQEYSPEELQQDVTFLFCDDFEMKCDDELTTVGEISFLTCYNPNNQICIIV